ncbi:DUF29 domain-containing protein [Teichococcus aestuarii]|uniref:DUF29 domain-containing protein n=1 Tax=Teichococcus aestuarii TaxID=568898 RepID=A0A2U1UXJ2_9PROT|nr:DUF29 domain-containing protein [Pseudoroseomonas aestuarii]PWC26389.1 hypothetical protein CR165_23430 [Pseudoroseomonas aestuarii]
MPDGLYDQDFFEWTREQAAALRAHTARSNAPLDFENLAEEIEALGRSERRMLASLIGTVIEHLLKLRFSPAADPRRGWQETVDRARRDIGMLLDYSPSLRREVPEIVTKQTTAAARMVGEQLARYGELDAEAASRLRVVEFAEADVLGGDA